MDLHRRRFTWWHRLHLQENMTMRPLRNGCRHSTEDSLRSSLNVPVCRMDQRLVLWAYHQEVILECQVMRVQHFGWRKWKNWINWKYKIREIPAESPLCYFVRFDRSFSTGFSNNQILIWSITTHATKTNNTFCIMCTKIWLEPIRSIFGEIVHQINSLTSGLSWIK